MQSEGRAESADDDTIVARVQQGDREAFAVLVTRYQRMVFALALRMTGSRDEAQDVTQTSFLNAFRRLADFRGEASFKTWIYGIALNECRMLHRRAKGDFSLDEVAEPVAHATGGHPLDRVVLGKLVARLPDKQRAALTLRVCEDLSFREIGALIGASEASAKVNYFHAVKKLRGWLAPGEGGKQPSPGEPGADRGGFDP
jgi:RNA polymerase sigma-70 factor (ECF subfamily)